MRELVRVAHGIDRHDAPVANIERRDRVDCSAPVDHNKARQPVEPNAMNGLGWRQVSGLRQAFEEADNPVANGASVPQTLSNVWDADPLRRSISYSPFATRPLASRFSHWPGRPVTADWSYPDPESIVGEEWQRRKELAAMLAGLESPAPRAFMQFPFRSLDEIKSASPPSRPRPRERRKQQSRSRKQTPYGRFRPPLTGISVRLRGPSPPRFRVPQARHRHLS